MTGSDEKQEGKGLMSYLTPLSGKVDFRIGILLLTKLLHEQFHSSGLLISQEV